MRILILQTCYLAGHQADNANCFDLALHTFHHGEPQNHHHHHQCHHPEVQVTVIPYAFSSVIKQLQAVQELEAKG